MAFVDRLQKFNERQLFAGGRNALILANQEIRQEQLVRLGRRDQLFCLIEQPLPGFFIAADGNQQQVSQPADTGLAGGQFFGLFRGKGDFAGGGARRGAQARRDLAYQGYVNQLGSAWRPRAAAIERQREQWTAER